MAVTWELDLFRPGDAQGLTDLYRSVYGENYHVKSVYDPIQLIAMQDSGEAYRAIARTSEGEIIGQPNFGNIRLYTDRAKALLALIRDDWQAVTNSTEAL